MELSNFIGWKKSSVRRSAAFMLMDAPLVFFDARGAGSGWQLPPAQPPAHERLARKLIPHSTDKPLSPNVIVRLGRSDHAAAFSPDGSRLAVWNQQNEKRLKIIDLTTGLVCSTFDFETLDDVHSIVFTRDSATLAFGGIDHKLRFWHLQAAKNPVVLRGHNPYETWSLAFSPDKKTLASAGDDHCIRLWDLETGEEKAILRGHEALVTSIAFAPDGRTLASASFDIQRPVALWDVATSTLRTVLRGHVAFARSVSFSPDGRILISSSDDRSVILYDVIRARRTATLSNHHLWVHCSESRRSNPRFRGSKPGWSHGLRRTWQSVNRHGLCRNLFTGLLTRRVAFDDRPCRWVDQYLGHGHRPSDANPSRSFRHRIRPGGFARRPHARIGRRGWHRPRLGC